MNPNFLSRLFWAKSAAEEIKRSRNFELVHVGIVVAIIFAAAGIILFYPFEDDPDPTLIIGLAAVIVIVGIVYAIVKIKKKRELEYYFSKTPEPEPDKSYLTTGEITKKR